MEAVSPWTPHGGPSLFGIFSALIVLIACSGISWVWRRSLRGAAHQGDRRAQGHGGAADTGHIVRLLLWRVHQTQLLWAADGAWLRLHTR